MSYSHWFLLALVLLGLELATGTFYLLVISFAMAVAGVAAWFSAGLLWSALFAALTILAGTLMLRRRNNLSGEDRGAVSLDTGQPVQVLMWQGNDRARVKYRGAEWDAVTEFPDMTREGVFYIKAIQGSVLILTHQMP